MRLLYPYLQKQVGGEGVNLGAVLSFVAIFVVLGGWLAWASGVGGKPMPSLRANMTMTAAMRVTADLNAPFTQVAQTPFYYGIIPVTPRPTSTLLPALLSEQQQIQATQTVWFALPTVAPTQTPFPWECASTPSVDDPCYKLYVEHGGEAAAVWYWAIRTTTPMPTAVPTERTFITWTPSPSMDQMAATMVGTLAAERAWEMLSATPPAAERTEERFSDEGAPQRGVRLPDES